MKICWKKNPEDRPDFQSLGDTLGEMLGYEEKKEVCGFAVFIESKRNIAIKISFRPSVEVINYIQLLDEAEQNIVIYRWRADQLFGKLSANN